MGRSASPSGAEPEVFAAGGVVVRRDQGERPLVAVIHRPEHGDWSLPKGKLDRGEDFKQAALREVDEEIGWRCRTIRELPPVSYRSRDGWKLVRYWLMEALEGRFRPHHEVDELRWVDAAGAQRLLSYEHDRALVAEALARDRGPGSGPAPG